MRRATGATLLREATSELANSDDSAAFAELSAPSSICGCPRTMRCASCARDYTHGAELRAGGPQERPFCARRPPSSPTLTTAQLSLSSQHPPASAAARGPCDARAVRATTRTAPSCVRAGLSYRACSRWQPRSFPALDGGRAAVTRVDRVQSRVKGVR